MSVTMSHHARDRHPDYAVVLDTEADIIVTVLFRTHHQYERSGATSSRREVSEMAMPRRTTPLHQIWSAWLLMGYSALKSGRREMFDLFITTTTLETMSGMLEAGVRPASHPTSTSKE